MRTVLLKDSAFLEAKERQQFVGLGVECIGQRLAVLHALIHEFRQDPHDLDAKRKRHVGQAIGTEKPETIRPVQHLPDLDHARGHAVDLGDVADFARIHADHRDHVGRIDVPGQAVEHFEPVLPAHVFADVKDVG